MRLIERHHGKPIEEIVADACRRHDMPEGAAYELGISRVTLDAWKRQLGITDASEEPAGCTS